MRCLSASRENAFIEFPQPMMNGVSLTHSAYMPPTSSVERVDSFECQVGESPLWHPEMQCLFYVDIPSGGIYAFTPATGQSTLFSKGPITGGMTLQEDGALLLFQDGRISVLKMDMHQQEVAHGLCPSNDRFNDVIADPEGRVFAGMMGGNGRLVRIDTDGSVTEICDGVAIPNGMGFTPDCRRMYFTDSGAREIYRFDYERSNGALSNKIVLASIPEHLGLPDGMAVDTDGFVWTAIWFGGCLRRFAPDGTLDAEVRFPVKQISSVTFGGQFLADIYVTTAASEEADRLRPTAYDINAPRGGGLYRLQIKGVRGRPAFRSRLRF
jgi:D-xylono/L-arabinono-1,4-lactonase